MRFDKWVSSQKKPIKPPQPVFPSLKDTLKSVTNCHGITVCRADSCYANRAGNNVCESGCELHFISFQGLAPAKAELWCDIHRVFSLCTGCSSLKNSTSPRLKPEL